MSASVYQAALLRARSERAGLKLQWTDGHLTFRGPGHLVTAAWRAEVSALKEELVRLLRREQGDEPAATPPDAPLSPAQRRLWLATQSAASPAAYNMAGAFWLEGPLAPDALGRAVESVLDRHEAVRTVFALVDDEPRQRILPAGTIRLAVEDLRDRPDPEHAAHQRVRDEQRFTFDLSRGPLVRCALLQVADRRWLLVLNLHHAVGDGWSMAVLTREISAGYNARRHGGAPTRPPLAFQYRDYAAWQGERLAAGGLDASRRYWRGKLAAPLPVMDLPADDLRTPHRSGRGACVQSRYDGLARLRTLAQQHDVTLFMLLVAATKVLLWRYTGVDDVIVGTPSAGRDDPGLEDQVGLYVSTLPLRDRISATDPFLAFLDRVKQTMLEAYTHQHFPFDELAGEIAPARDPGRNPIFDVMVVMHQHWSALDLEGVGTRRLDLPPAACKFDQTILFTETAGGLDIAVEYDADLFARWRIAALIAHLRVLLDAILDQPAAAVADLEILTEAERRQFLADPEPAG